MAYMVHMEVAPAVMEWKASAVPTMVFMATAAVVKVVIFIPPVHMV